MVFRRIITPYVAGSSPSEPRQTETSPLGARQLRPALPAILVALALLALALVPIIIEVRVDAIRQEGMRMADPLRTSVREIQVALALETAGTRGYLLTGDSVYARKHREARARRVRALNDLLVVTREFPEIPELHARTRALAAQLGPGDALLDSLFRGQISRAEYTQVRLPMQQARLERVIATARELGNFVSDVAAARLDAIHREQNIGVIVIAFLVVVAGIASVMVARLGFAYRTLAERAHYARLESEAARAEAEQRSRDIERMAASRARLVRGFTHDVKNPLGAAAGQLSLMEDGVVPPHEGMPRVKRSLHSALSLIDDLLQLARAEFGEITVQRVPTDLGTLVQQAVEDVRAPAEAKGLWLQLDIPDDLPRIETDPGRIRQILGNLLSNAVKYTVSGSVGVSVRTQQDEQGCTLASITVADTGPGLTAEQARSLFQEFHRLPSSAGTSGNGLGLAISKRIAEALGGDITVESAVNVGSNFRLVVPCGRAESVPAGI